MFLGCNFDACYSCILGFIVDIYSLLRNKDFAFLFVSEQLPQSFLVSSWRIVSFNEFELQLNPDVVSFSG